MHDNEYDATCVMDNYAMLHLYGHTCACLDSYVKQFRVSKFPIYMCSLPLTCIGVIK